MWWHILTQVCAAPYKPEARPCLLSSILLATQSHPDSTQQHWWLLNAYVCVLQGLYQMFWLFLILYGLPQFFSEYALPSQGSTAPGYLSYAGVMTQRLPKDIPPLTGMSRLTMLCHHLQNL